MAAIRHSGVVQIFEHGHVDEKPYLVLEYIAGGSLAQMLRGKPLTEREAARIAVIVASTTEVAHELGIVHRDLKPSNILMTQNGEPKIADFGLAKHFDSIFDSELTKSTSRPLELPHTWLPSKPKGKLVKSDLLPISMESASCSYEMLTGSVPFRGASG